MSRRVVHGFEGLRALLGVELPATAWLTVDQERIDAFAACTGDAQWIHVDLQRARQGPFGTRIAHGYLALALIPRLWEDHIEVTGIASVVNYGLDRVRFPSPIASGSRIRAHFVVTHVDDAEGGLRVKKRVTIEVEGRSKPACVAETIALYRPLPAG